MAFYLERYRMLDPAARAWELGIDYRGGAFTVTMLRSAYRVTWPEGEISAADDGAVILRNGGQILLMRYLIEGKALPASGHFMTFRQMPWGEVYITTYNGRCINRLAHKFGKDLDGFRRAAEALGGRPLDHGDAGYEFDFIGDYRLRLFLWAGDDEFPPNAQILYTDNFAAGFTAEDNVVVAELLITALSDKLKAIKR